MILEALQRIKSFYLSPSSTVTPEEIAAKEAELGFPLPEALREFYLTFSYDDPIFSGDWRMLPLEELKICTRRDTNIFTLLPVFRDEAIDWAFLISIRCGNRRYQWREDMDLSDPHMYVIYLEPATKGQEKFVENPTHSSEKLKLSNWLVDRAASELVLLQPSVAAVNGEKLNIRQGKQEWRREFQEFPQEMPLRAFYYNQTRITEEPPLIWHTRSACSWTYYFGAQSDEVLEQKLKQWGMKCIWIKSQSGHPVWSSTPPEPPQARELLSIAPVLDFLCRFAGIDGKGVKEESLQRAQARLGGTLPLPMAEFYRRLPRSCYNNDSTLRPLSSLKADKSGKLAFLTENQEVYRWAAELNSPFVYRCTNSTDGEWAPCGILDGFLAAEFLWALAWNEELELDAWEFEDFEPEMLEEGGQLAPLLSPIEGLSGLIAVGNTRQLYQAAEGRAVGFYDRAENAFWFVTRGSEAERELEDLLGFPHEDEE